MTTEQRLEHAIENGNHDDRSSHHLTPSVTDGGSSHPPQTGGTTKSPAQILNRGYNLMITAFLFLIGLAMGSNALPEGGVSDKVDDFGLFAVGLIAVVWYLSGSNRFTRSRIPIALALVAVAVQVLGVVLEAGDDKALGDNIGGMLMLVPLTLFAIWQYVRVPEWAKPSMPGPQSSHAMGTGITSPHSGTEMTR